MKRLLMLLLAATVLLCCANVSAEEDILLDRNTLVNEYGLPDEEYLDGFMNEYNLTSSFANMVNLEELYAQYKNRKTIEANSFRYLLECERTYQDTQLRAESVIRILWFWNTDSDIRVSLYDFGNDSVYHGDYNILNDISEVEPTNLSADRRAQIIKTIEKNNVLEWKDFYTSEDSEDGTAWVYWRLAIEYEDGRVFVSEGSGTDSAEHPETYEQVQKVLNIIQ